MLQIISAYICGIITTIEVVVFGKLVLDEKIKVSNKKIFIIGIITSLLYATSYLLLKGTIKTLTMFLVDICFYKYVFKISNRKAIFVTFLCMTILLLSDLINLLLPINLLKISKEFYYKEFAGSILGTLITCIIFIIITNILKSLLRNLVNAKIENDIKIIVFIVLISICVYMFFYTIIKEFRFSNDIVLYLIAIIVLVSVLFSLIRQTIENNKLIKKYDKLLEFMTTYENEIEKQRVLRHETKNEFLSIRGKIHDKQNNKEIIAYIDEILKEKIEVKQEEYAKFGYLPANGIKGLCYLKTQEAQDKGLNTAINISKRIKNSNIYGLDIKEQRDLGKILGVFLDNAIEASLKSKAKEFGIESYLNLDKQCQIIIANSYDEKIDLDKIGKEKFSTKGKNRGHGLLLVKHIVGNNNIFETKTDIINGLYIQTVTITKKTTKNQTKKQPSTK